MHFRVKQLSRMKKNEGKNTIYLFIFSTTHSYGENLQGFIAQETKIGVIEDSNTKT